MKRLLWTASIGVAMAMTGCHHAQVTQPYAFAVSQGTEKDKTAISTMKRADYRIQQETSGKACAAVLFGVTGGPDPVMAKTDDGEAIILVQRGVSLSQEPGIESEDPRVNNVRAWDRTPLWVKALAYAYVGVGAVWHLTVIQARNELDAEGIPYDQDPDQYPILFPLQQAAVFDALAKVDKHGYLVEPKYEWQKDTVLGFGTVCVTARARVLTLGSGPVARANP